jgi:predicted transcriptional regulator
MVEGGKQTMTENPAAKAMASRLTAARMMELANAFRTSRAIHLVAELGIADLLKHGPLSSAELAAQTNTNPHALHRVLRALAAVGVFHEGQDRRFSLTEVGESLRSDAPNSVLDWAKYIGRPYIWQTWTEFLYSVRNRKSAFEHVHGCEAWDYRARHPEENLSFDRAMTEVSRAVADAVVRTYDFSAFKQIVDVGGGHGILLIRILQSNEHLRGILFDQPQVVAGAREPLEAAGVLSRCELASGSFFDAIPAGADAYMMKAIIHDWDDEHSIAILKRIREAIPPSGKLLVLERVLGGPNEDPEAKLSDLHMLVVLGGQERSREEFAKLFDASGFRLDRVVPAGRYSVIEGSPV